MTTDAVDTMTNRETMNALKAKRARLEAQLAQTRRDQTDAHARVAVAVATDETTPDDWHATASRLDTTVRALELGIRQTDDEMQQHRNACQLAIVRIEQKRLTPAEHTLQNLKGERVAVLRHALESVTHRNEATPADFPANITRIETAIRDADEEIAAATADIAALRAE